ncbi:MAG: glycosyltransferase family 2 protein [Methylophilaceae bacterium]
MTYKDLTIIITTFKSEQKIRECLSSIDPKINIILIENSSSIEFKKDIESNFSNVSCELTNDNLGYGKANNIGLKKVKTKYALILNPDTILSSNTLELFFEFIKTNEDFTILGPNQNEKLSTLDNHKKGEIEFFETDKIKGYAMFLNMEKLKSVGFYDENIFLYLEEIDLCKRVKDAKGKILICPNIIIFHYGAQSVNNEYANQIELTRNWHWMWSLFYFNKKHYGYLSALILILPKLLSSIIKMSFYFLISNKQNKEIYSKRFSGIINSMLGKNSWYRPNLD